MFCVAARDLWIFKGEGFLNLVGKHSITNECRKIRPPTTILDLKEAFKYYFPNTTIEVACFIPELLKQLKAIKSLDQQIKRQHNHE